MCFTFWWCFQIVIVSVHSVSNRASIRCIRSWRASQKAGVLSQQRHAFHPWDAFKPLKNIKDKFRSDMRSMWKREPTAAQKHEAMEQAIQHLLPRLVHWHNHFLDPIPISTDHEWTINLYEKDLAPSVPKSDVTGPGEWFYVSEKSGKDSSKSMRRFFLSGTLTTVEIKFEGDLVSTPFNYKNQTLCINLQPQNSPVWFSSDRAVKSVVSQLH